MYNRSRGFTIIEIIVGCTLLLITIVTLYVLATSHSESNESITNTPTPTPTQIIAPVPTATPTPAPVQDAQTLDITIPDFYSSWEYSQQNDASYQIIYQNEALFIEDQPSEKWSYDLTVNSMDYPNADILSVKQADTSFIEYLQDNGWVNGLYGGDIGGGASYYYGIKSGKTRNVLFTTLIQSAETNLDTREYVCPCTLHYSIELSAIADIEKATK